MKTMRVLQRAVTVGDLIEELQTLDPKARVLFACDYGDISHTQQVLGVENVDEYDQSQLEESGYSNSGVALREDSNEEEDADQPVIESGTTVVVLS